VRQQITGSGAAADAQILPRREWLVSAGSNDARSGNASAVLGSVREHLVHVLFGPILDAAHDVME
jgi:hypothetical protein